MISLLDTVQKIRSSEYGPEDTVQQTSGRARPRRDAAAVLRFRALWPRASPAFRADERTAHASAFRAMLASKNGDSSWSYNSLCAPTQQGVSMDLESER
jgi:hypothetical protein